jgi:general stress protein 26
MDEATRKFVLDIIEQAKDLTLATIREDGYPQATTVSFGHDGLTIYVSVGRHSQKAENIRHCNKISLTVNAPYSDWQHIKGVSLGGVAEILEEPADIQAAEACLIKRFPQVKEWATPDVMQEVVFLKIEPQIISVLDYEKGFGHTELVNV